MSTETVTTESLVLQLLDCPPDDGCEPDRWGRTGEPPKGNPSPLGRGGGQSYTILDPKIWKQRLTDYVAGPPGLEPGTSGSAGLRVRVERFI